LTVLDGDDLEAGALQVPDEGATDFWIILDDHYDAPMHASIVPRRLPCAW